MKMKESTKPKKVDPAAPLVHIFKHAPSEVPKGREVEVLCWKKTSHPDSVALPNKRPATCKLCITIARTRLELLRNAEPRPLTDKSRAEHQEYLCALEALF